MQRSTAPDFRREELFRQFRLSVAHWVTRLVATSLISGWGESATYRKRSGAWPARPGFESMAATTSSSFFPDVTTIQHGAMILQCLQKVLADLAKLFDGCPQVLDLVATAGNAAHFVIDEDQPCSSSSSPEFSRAFDELADRDRGDLVALSAYESGEDSRWLKPMQYCTRGGFARLLTIFQSLFRASCRLQDKLVELAFGLELDFQFCDVEIFRVSESRKTPGTSTRWAMTFSGVILLGDTGRVMTGWGLGVDQVDAADAGITQLLLE